MTKYHCRTLTASLLLAIAAAAAPEELLGIPQDVLQPLLPPQPEWDASKSMAEFVVGEDDPFVTPAEASNFTETALYSEVQEYITMMASEFSDNIRVETIATLTTGHDIWLVIVSPEGKFTNDEMTLPNLYVTATIHPGESSGLNAGLMLMRNMVTNTTIEWKTNLLFVPIFNVGGMLRQSAEGRINQHGPNTSGRRSNDLWLNLNRDFGKLDAIETRAVVKVMNDYDIAFYTDTHSTDGVSYQPDVTYCDNGDAGLSNAIYGWLRSEMEPSLNELLEQYNHIPGVCYYANDNMDPTAGYYPYFSDGAAYSGNYADHRQIPAYLLELFSLKPNLQRVLGAYAFLFGLATIVGEKADSLRAAIEEDRAARVDPVPIAWDYDDPAPMVEWPIFEYEVVTNPILGVDQIVWTDIPLTITVEQSTRSTPLNPPTRPYAYIIPSQWTDVIEVLGLHGIAMERLTYDVTFEDVSQYRIEDATVNRLREGRPEMTGTPVLEQRSRTYIPGDIVIKTDQPLGTLAVALLEPVGESSFFLWGFFASRFTSHEYPENYIMIPLAEYMLSQSEELAAEWEAHQIENPGIVNDTASVVDWFFRRSRFYDDEAYVYPVGILYSEPTSSLPLEPYVPGADIVPEEIPEESNDGCGPPVEVEVNGDYSEGTMSTHCGYFGLSLVCLLLTFFVL